jgi:dihydroflavonol-4-reductase
VSLPGPGRAVLVTGGAGFLGAAVVRRLLARGADVHVVARASTDRAPLAGCPVHWYTADLEDEGGMRAAVATAARSAGAALDVVHLAARISYRRADRELLRRTNVDGTRHVLAACEASGVRRLCHVSSVVALGAVPDAAHELDDDAPLGGKQLDCAYARTKAEAEELVLAAAARRDVVVASPAVVFGSSGAAANSLHFVRRVVRGTLGPLSPPGSLSVVGLDDAAEGILLVLERGARGRRHLLAESAWSLHALLSLACELAGRRPPRARVPPDLWRIVVGAAALANRIVPSERATPEALALLGMHFRFCARRARVELGWRPRDLRSVLAPIVAELLHEDERT